MSSAPARLDLSPMSGTSVRKRSDAQGVSVLRVRIVSRGDVEAGVVLGRKMLAVGLSERLVAEIASMSDASVGLDVGVWDPATEPAADVVRVSVEKAYVRGVYDAKSAAVVIAVQAGDEIVRFRGQAAGVNWLNSSTEMADLLILALNRALPQVEAYLRGLAGAPLQGTDDKAG